MSRTVLLVTLIMAAGCVLAGWGLYHPIWFIPVVGKIEYRDNTLTLGGQSSEGGDPGGSVEPDRSGWKGIAASGSQVATVLLCLMGLAAGAALLVRRVKLPLAICAMLGLGLLMWSGISFAVQRLNALKELADAGLVNEKTIKDGMHAEAGFLYLAYGVLVWLSGAIWALCISRGEPRGREKQAGEKEPAIT